MTSYTPRYLPRLHAVALVLWVATGCVGNIDGVSQDNEGGSPDAGELGAPDADPDSPDAIPGSLDAGSPDAARACDDPIASGNPGVHKAGQACRTGCHTASTAGPAFTVAGTLYTDEAGSAPIDGATIHVIDANGDEITLVTKQNGNFWTNSPVVFPLAAYASRCPDNADKVTPVTQAGDGGNCNRAGCHAAGSRIYLP